MDPKHRHYISYEDDRFFESSSNLAGAISGNGPHTLVVKCVQGPLLLDYFVTDGAAVAPAAVAPPASTTQRSVVNPPAGTTSSITTCASFKFVVWSPLTRPYSVVTQTQTVTNTQTSTSDALLQSTSSTESSTSSLTTSGTGTSSSTTSVVSQGLSVDPSTGQTVTKFQVVTTSFSGVGSEVTLYPDGNGRFGATGAAKKTNIGTIIGAIVGSIAFLLLLILLIVLCIRRKRRVAAVRAQSAQDNEGLGDMRENHLQRGASGLSAYGGITNDVICVSIQVHLKAYPRSRFLAG